MGPAHRLRAVLVRFGGGSLRLQIMTGVALAATVALVLGVLWADRDLPSGDEPGDVVRVGVVEGQSVSGYLRASQDELDRLTDPSAPVAGDTWALVSLRAYAVPARLAGLLGGVAVAQVYARVPLPEARTQVTRIPVYRMPDDVTSGMLNAALTRDQEQADYLRLSRALKADGAKEARLRTTYESAARVAAAEAAAYRAGCECLFAAVVRATPATLSELAGQRAVRSVDPAPEVRRLDRTEFRPPLPEDAGTVEPQPSAPTVPGTAVPDATPAVAPVTPTPIPSSIGTPVTSASPEISGRESIPAVLPSEQGVAVPSAPDASPVREGSGPSSAASS
ncbi:hypothetical protein AB0F81_28610 [Actinoplanes sp. NPDC024001]|uniref:hypothetical protein n=1 Tax=Actinoplanes sp. NPDC024001 TaxID=3154598 RepID=UPI0033DE78C3